VASNCTNGFPPADNYRTHTLDDTLCMQHNSFTCAPEKGKQQAQTSRPTTTKAATSTHDAQGTDENLSMEATNKNDLCGVWTNT